MKDTELEVIAKESNLSAPKPSKYTLRSLIMFVSAMGGIWFIGAILTPLLPEELIIMLVYAVLYYFFGFDPIKIAEKFFKK